MIRTDEKQLCSGCGVCGLVCPKQCITFVPDLLGGLYAKVDEKECIECGACEIVCPLQQSFNNTIIGEKAYVAFSSDKGIRFRGSSGGIFETVASWIINQNGYVFACKLDSELKLRMFEVSNLNEVREFTKSKYLQCDSISSYQLIRTRIKQGKRVLVCSTPCQISALSKYLGSLAQSDNLYLLDFFCHGVPSQIFFDKCREYIERRDGIKVKGYEFRSKVNKGASPHYYSLTYEKNGENVRSTYLYLEDPFYLGFQKYITLRDSCYHCPFGSGNHVGDLTLGDFHDIDKYIKGLNRFDGVSTVIINSNKGFKIWKAIKDSLEIYEIDINQLYSNHQIYTGGTKEPETREVFLRDLEMLPFDSVVKKWFNPKQEWKKAIYYRLPFPMRKILKAISEKNDRGSIKCS